jgi:hypothetical protein
MPEKETLERAEKDKREGKAASTQAGEFVREEIEHVREGKHGARSAKQVIAIGLSKARRAGVKLPPPKNASAEIKEQAARETRKAKSGGKAKTSAKRSRASLRKLKGEGHSAASKTALSRHARSVASKRSAASRSKSAKKAAATRKK